MRLPYALEASSPEGSVSHSDESDRAVWPPSRVAGPSPYRNYRGNVSPAQEAVTSTPSSTSSLSRSLPHQPFLFQDLDDRGPGLRPPTAKVSSRDVSGTGDVLPDDVGDPTPPFSLNTSAYVSVRRNAIAYPPAYSTEEITSPPHADHVTTSGISRKPRSSQQDSSRANFSTPSPFFPR